jgi:hypothetical protein
MTFRQHATLNEATASNDQQITETVLKADVTLL